MTELSISQITDARNGLRRSYHRVSNAHGFVGLNPLSSEDDFQVLPMRMAGSDAEDMHLEILDSVDSLCDGSDIRPYSPGFRPSSAEAGVLRFDRDKSVLDFCHTVLSCLDTPRTFEHDDGSVRRLRFHGCISEHDDYHRRIATVRIIGPSKSLSQSRFFGLTFSNGAYDKVSDKTLLLDTKVDLVIHDHMIYILNGAAFEKLFYEIDAEDARSRLSQITRHIPISNSDDFIDACSRQFQMRRKIRMIAEKDYLRLITMDDIKDTIEHSDIDIKIDSGGLVFDNNVERRWLILKLLDDDFLESRLTKRMYDSNSKTFRG